MLSLGHYPFGRDYECTNKCNHLYADCSLMNVKNPVYQVPYTGCPATYVGQTSRRLNQRLSEHKQAVESGEPVRFKLAEHAWGGTPAGRLGQGQGVGPSTPSPPETNPGVHLH